MTARVAHGCPPADAVVDALVRCLAAKHRGMVELVGRTPNAYQSSSPSEIIRCRMGREELRIFCKYGHVDDDPPSHRGGSAREARVYRDVLTPLRLRPRFFGSDLDPATGRTWLFLEYLGERLRVQKARQPEAILWAVEWAARFHSMTEDRAAIFDFLPCYDLDYYLSWVERTARFSAPLARELSWLHKLLQRAECLLSALLEGPQTVVHAEYFPQNVLVLDSEACPVDWESTAIAPGELDLASLTTGWSHELQSLAEERYVSIRPRGRLDDFQERLAAGRLYWACRWLGEKPELTLAPVCRVWFDELHEVGSRFGLI